MSLSLAIALVVLLVTVLVALEMFIGHRSVRSLRDVVPDTDHTLPKVSIIVAARNEQRNIREALQSLLNLSYPEYELIVVNDRSEDDTQTILEQMSASQPRLKLLQISELPSGWLGKNHALWAGSQQATGELLLFTDADIIMEPTVLNRTVTFLVRNRIDHLAATPLMTMPTAFLGMFGAAFVIIFSLFVRPWKARDPRSRFHIGIGAFNLVRTQVYRNIGGHVPIRLRPDDDIKLGKLLKKEGYRQDVVYGSDYLAVEWYASTGELIRGLEKNAFSGADYSILLVLAGAFINLMCNVWPFLALVTTSGATQGIYLATVTIILLMVADSARFHKMPSWYALGYPLVSALFVYIMLRTMTLNILQGGINWRGTFYPLEELKKNQV
jgi:cellulose synthase/poly-beta-1,6-N-acetylglucosamine synthase-like glycosyltransferase